MKPPADAPRLRKIALAKKLAVSRPTLDKYLAMPGAPRESVKHTFNVEAVIKFIAANAERAGADIKDEAKGPTLNNWRAKKLELECVRMETEIATARGDHISKSQAATTIVPLMTELGQAMKQEFELTLPSQYIGKDAVECALLNAKALDKIIATFRRGMAKFTG